MEEDEEKEEEAEEEGGEESVEEEERDGSAGAFVARMGSLGKIWRISSRKNLNMRRGAKSSLLQLPRVLTPEVKALKKAITRPSEKSKGDAEKATGAGRVVW